MRAPLLVVLALLVAGCADQPEAPTPTPTPTPAPEPTTPSPAPTPEEPPVTLALRVMPEEVAVQPGHEVGVLVEMFSLEAGNATLRVEHEGRTVEAQAQLPAQTPRAVWVALEVPADAEPGETAADLVVEMDGEVVLERPGALRVRTLGPGAVFEPGDSAEVVYTGRFSDDGRAFNTNDPAIEEAAFPQAESYRFSAGTLHVESLPRPSVVEGFYEGILGMQEGESRLVAFPAEKGYGDATRRESEPRDEALERDFVLELRVQRAPREALVEHLETSGQSDEDGPSAGDRFTVHQNGNDWPYLVLNATDAEVEYRLAVSEGENYTVFDPWPNASVVQSVNDTHAIFHTTPTTAPGEPFTMRSEWDGLTSVKSMNETHVVVRHSPPVGLVYTRVIGGAPQQARVVELTEEEVVVEVENPHPLAGEDLTFHIRVVSLTKAEQKP